MRRFDFSTLEKTGGSVITDDLRERHDDVIWRLRWKNGEEEHWFWVYLLLELQSTPDRFMAVRLLTYVGLLFQELIREKKLEPGGLLPPVLPVVLYHGKRRWRASSDLGSLFTPVPRELKRDLPQLRYRLLDAGKLPLDRPDLRDNLVAALLRLETAEARKAASLVKELNVLVPADDGLRRIIDIWLDSRFRKYPFGATIPAGKISLGGATMLDETFKEWEQKMRQQGRREAERETQKLLQQEHREVQKMLLGMLRDRFGPIPQAVRQRVKDLSSSELRTIARRLITANSLQETGLLDATVEVGRGAKLKR